MESFLAAVFEGADTVAVVAVVAIAQGFAGGRVAGFEFLRRWGRLIVVCCSFLDLGDLPLVEDWDSMSAIAQEQG